MFSTIWKQQGCFSLDCKNLISPVASVLPWTCWVYLGSWPLEVTGAGSCVSTWHPNVTALWWVTTTPSELGWSKREDEWWVVAVWELRHAITSCHQPASAVWCWQHSACHSSMESGWSQTAPWYRGQGGMLCAGYGPANKLNRLHHLQSLLLGFCG